MMPFMYDFFYGTSVTSSRQFEYLDIPANLITNECFSGLSMDAKILYSLMLERMGSSAAEECMDEYGRTFVRFEDHDAYAEIRFSSELTHSCLKELENYRLIVPKEGEAFHYWYLCNYAAALNAENNTERRWRYV